MFHEKLIAALLAVAIAAAAVLAAAKFSIEVLALYGWSLYFAVPLMCGAAASLIYNRKGDRALRESFRVSFIAGVVSLSGFLLLGMEGLICIFMASPLALPLFMLGGFIGHRIRGAFRGGKTSDIASLILFAFVPFLMGFESALNLPPKERGVSTSVLISADSADVWREVIAFSPIPAPTELIFRMGIAYPTHAEIIGTGVGAIRYCRFSTGDFVEPITTWEEGSRLAFTVSEQPVPMTEISPYAGVSPPHMDWVFRSKRGEFLLNAREDGTIELTGNTWYELSIEPAFYWGWASDALVRTIHRRVLNHIKSAVESAAARPAADA